MNLAQWLLRTARLQPQSPALFQGTRQVADYGAFADRAARIAGHFRSVLGLNPGDRIALAMVNCTEYLELLYGAWWAGLVAVPINAKLHEKEIEYILVNSGAAALAASGEIAARLAPVIAHLPCSQRLIVPGTPSCEMAFRAEASASPVHRAPDDLAWLFYTSGTTGRPKGVMLTHRNLMTMTGCYFTDVDTAEREDAIIYAAPMSHGAGLYNFAHVLVGARHVVPESGGFEPAELVELAQATGRVSLFAAPTMVKRLVDHIEATGSGSDGFKTIVYGGGPMYVEDIRRALDVMGNRFVQIYGQGETPMTITALSRGQLADRAHPRHLERIGSVGVAQSMVEVRVADGEGRALPAGETGEILVRGDTVMAGYWNDPGNTAATIRDGWLHTGDVGALDQDGFLTLKDRSKDVIISGGSNIYPREVEEVLLRHDAVAEVSVVGARDAQWGEAVVAFVVRAPGRHVDEAALDALCLEHIARFKRPKAYRFVSALPKNNYGKVLKTELRAQLALEASRPDSGA